MATDAYLQIDGIKGESADSGHQGWIELGSVSFGVMQPTVGSKSSSGHTAGHCEHRTLSLSKIADLASPILMQHCSMGKTIPKARLEFMRADGDGKRVKYFAVLHRLHRAGVAGHLRPQVWHREHQHRRRFSI